jgi:type I restriction enzyme S subunit
MSKWKETEIGILPDDWEVVNIGSLIEEKGIAVGVMYPGDFTVGGTPLLRAGDINTGKIDKRINYQISKKTNEIYERTVLQGCELLVVLVGNPGVSVVVSDYFKGWNVARAIGVLKLKDKSDGSYISYSLQHPGVRNLLLTSCNTTVQPTLNLKELKDVIIPWPTSSLRNTISSILSSLDDKIDLLHRQNATLEKMAETLFRQWFVEEAKEEWEEGKLSDLVIVKYGKDHKRLLDGKIPVFGSGGIMRYADKALYNLESVLIPRKGTLSNVIYIDEPFWSVDTMFYTEMRRQNLAKFIFYFVKGLDLASMNVGSAVPSMTTEVLNNLPIDIPSDVVLERFEQALSPLYKKMKSNQTQIRTLTALRDTLLPKLMSGEVRVLNE